MVREINKGCRKTKDEEEERNLNFKEPHHLKLLQHLLRVNFWQPIGTNILKGMNELRNRQEIIQLEHQAKKEKGWETKIKNVTTKINVWVDVDIGS